MIRERRNDQRAVHALQLTGLVAAVLLAGVANILAARHFARWDWTKDSRWSLSPATVETLRGLDQPIDVWAIAGPGDPFEKSLRQMLTAYQAASSQIEVHWIDPDRDTVQLVDLTRRFDLEAGRTEDGRVATDAVVIVASGERHWFLTPADLVEQPDDVHVKPREERVLTQAIRHVCAGEKAKLCFTVGHGELSLDDSKERESLGSVRDLLQKGNYELASVDTTAPDAHEPFVGCSVVVIAGPNAPFTPEETNRLRAWLLSGGSLFAVVGPIEQASPTGMVSAGLDAALSPFGIGIEDDLVHDLDPQVSVPDTHGEGFFVTARPHPVTASLVAKSADDHPPRVAIFYARSLQHVSAPDASWGAELLVTTDGAFAKKSTVGSATWTDAPARASGDAAGPFVVAMAGERPSPAGSAHPSRAVVVGSRFVLADDNWRQPRALHGAAFFVDSAISWLAARPAIVDVPDRAEVAAGMRVSESGREEVRRYVLLLMPAAAALLGVTVWAWRRSSENRPYEPIGARRRGEPS
ncbi:MAG TPA: GldG family protein [Polyangiaceae bacterium]|nr:GldG family protein [Polyangiaceae bacterium]